METHVKVLGVLHIALGAFGLLCAMALMLIFGGAAGIVGASGDADAQIAIPIIGITGTALVGFVTAFSLPGVIIGIGLVKYQPWARVAGIALSILDLIWVPFGTLIGLYGLWVLFSKDSERLFSRALSPQT
jgi:energy-converting hydrogenase Eha subunit H